MVLCSLKHFLGKKWLLTPVELIFCIKGLPTKNFSSNSNFEQKWLQRHLEAEHESKKFQARPAKECSKVPKICTYFSSIFLNSFWPVQANSENLFSIVPKSSHLLSKQSFLILVISIYFILSAIVMCVKACISISVCLSFRSNLDLYLLLHHTTPKWIWIKVKYRKKDPPNLKVWTLIEPVISLSPEHILVIPKFSQIKFGPIWTSKNGPNWQYRNIFNFG